MTRSRIFHYNLPPTQPGMTIGLYGGSFNPAHDGHRHVALTALKRLNLDRIWCLVTPGNPLKNTSSLPSLEERMDNTAALMDHPRVSITGAEATAGTRYTAESLGWIMERTKEVQLVWIMGADNLEQFHLWQHWQSIMRQVPVAIVDRPGYSFAPVHAMAAQHFAYARVPDHKIPNLPHMKLPAWSFLYGPRSELSSTDLRQSSGAQ